MKRLLLVPISTNGYNWGKFLHRPRKTPTFGRRRIELDISEELQQQILNEYAISGKLSAVRVCRDATGCSLREAKSTVEKLVDGHGKEISTKEDQKDQVLDHIFAGEKILAIKQYIGMTNVGLREAKEYIEELTEQLKIESPDQFTKNKTAGCLGLISVLILLAIHLFS
jgi:ribosomal protein L7/L12